jgi:hypothetical protein
MLEGDDDHARKVVLVEGAVELTALFEPQRGLQREMSLVIDHGIGHRRRFVVARQQHGRPEVDRAAPEFRE